VKDHGFLPEPIVLAGADQLAFSRRVRPGPVLVGAVRLPAQARGLVRPVGAVAGGLIGGFLAGLSGASNGARRMLDG
jgi:hypothetical protein